MRKRFKEIRFETKQCDINDLLMTARMLDECDTICEETDDGKMEYIREQYGNITLPDGGLDFYYNCLVNGLDLLQANEYAMFNTIIGYDIGMATYEKLSEALGEESIEMCDLMIGEKDRDTVKAIAKSKGIRLDYSNWRMEQFEDYEFFD